MRPSQLAGPASQPSTVAPRRLPPHAPKLLRARARAAARPPPACRRPPGRVDDARSPSRSPCSLSLSPALSFLSLALSLTRPNTTVATVRRSSRLRPPLAPPTSSEAPPQLPLPPHRSTGLRKPCIAATSPFPSSDSDHRRRQIRRLRRVPEPASTPTATAVSPRSVSPFSPALSRPLGPSPTAAKSFTPPAMSPSWPRSP